MTLIEIFILLGLLAYCVRSMCEVVYIKYATKRDKENKELTKELLYYQKRQYQIARDDGKK